MRPRKVVLLLAPEGYVAGCERLRLLELPVDVWGYRAVLPPAYVAAGSPSAAVLCAPSVPQVVAMAKALQGRWPDVRFVVLGPFGGPEREALNAVGLSRVLQETPAAVLLRGGMGADMQRLREMLRSATARKRGPQPVRVVRPLAPLAVQMERAA